MDAHVVVVRGRPTGAALVYAMSHPPKAAHNNAPASEEDIQDRVRLKNLNNVMFGKPGALNGSVTL